MTTYELPAEPAGPVWDRNGTKWGITRSGDGHWTDGDNLHFWAYLLKVYGPLSDFPTFKVGDTITLEEFSKLPEGSVAGTDVTAYVVHSDGIRSTYSRDLLDREVTVLRVGDGSQS